MPKIKTSNHWPKSPLKRIESGARGKGLDSFGGGDIAFCFHGDGLAVGMGLGRGLNRGRREKLR